LTDVPVPELRGSIKVVKFLNWLMVEPVVVPEPELEPEPEPEPEDPELLLLLLLFKANNPPPRVAR
jgi:hypothetical protein